MLQFSNNGSEALQIMQNLWTRHVVSGRSITNSAVIHRCTT